MMKIVYIPFSQVCVLFICAVCIFKSHSCMKAVVCSEQHNYAVYIQIVFL